MLFASPTFLFFFLPACLALYFASPSMGLKNGVLLALSLIFYAWGEPLYALLMIAMTAFNYAAARVIDGQAGRARKIALGFAVAVNLGSLALFKYAGFIVANLNIVLPAGEQVTDPRLPLPLGISFFTFHGLSYLIDTYRRRFPANRRFDEVALYIAFFPQLIAGPIVRYKTIARRLRKRRHSLGRASAGLRIFVIGLAQKLLLADPLAPLAEAVFDKAKHPGLVEAWTGALAYSLQLYFDFAGYSTMAIGLGVVFGFSLPRNFRTPYASASITEFWRRWHISLSSWFRDYLYIPLGGSRGSAFQTYRNLIVVFLLCGLWHGASWTFVLWGAWHGLFLVLERAGLGRLLGRARGVNHLYAVLVVMLGWVLFRAADLDRALDVWGGMAGLNGVANLSPGFSQSFQSLHLWLIPVAAVIAVAPRWRLPRWSPAPAARAWIDNGVILGLFSLATLRIAAGTYSPFLYFRF